MSQFVPEELVVTILARQSTKDLARFKCVCKSWRDLINSRYFGDNYRDMSPTKFVSYYDKALYLLAMEDNNPVMTKLFQLDLSYDQCPEIYEFTSVLLCDGALCVTLKNHNLMVCNPSSKQVKFVPKNPDVYKDGNMLGFGYDSVNDDYKIVTFVDRNMLETSSSTAYVFEFRTGSWRESFVIHKPDWYYRNREGTYLNQYIYWIRYYWSNGDRFVLCFNLSIHQYHKMPLPPVCNKGLTSSWLGVTSQKLCIADYDSGKHEIRISLLENTGQWNIIKSVSMLNLISVQDLQRHQIDFVSFTKKNDLFVSVTVEGAKKKQVFLWKTGEKRSKRFLVVAGFRFLREYVETPINRIFI